MYRWINKKVYKAVLWIVVILVVLSFLLTMVLPLWAASSPDPASSTGALALASANDEEASVSWFARWITCPWVGGILIAIGMAGLALELFALSWGAAGTLGIISLAVFFIGNGMVGSVNWTAIALFAAGLVLVLVEILALPGSVVYGALGFIGLAAAVAIASGSVLLASLYLVGALLATVLVLLCAFKVIDLAEIWHSIRHGKHKDRSVTKMVL